MTDIIELTELVEIAPADAHSVFTLKRSGEESHPIDAALSKVRAVIDAFEADVETPAGRKAIASLAHRIARAKTAIDAAGKTVADDVKEIPKIVDANRRHAKTTLEEWQKEVRQPLNDWEAAEEQRINAIKSKVEWIERLQEDLHDIPSREIGDRLEMLADLEISEDTFAEFASAAAEICATTKEMLEEARTAAVTRETEAAELAELRKKVAEQEAREERDRIAKEAAEAARKKAEDEAAEKISALERDTEERVARAVEQAKQEQAAQVKRSEDETKKRAADIDHRASVNRAARNAMVEEGIPADIATSVVILIAKNAIPNVRIEY